MCFLRQRLAPPFFSGDDIETIKCFFARRALASYCAITFQPAISNAMIGHSTTEPLIEHSKFTFTDIYGLVAEYTSRFRRHAYTSACQHIDFKDFVPPSWSKPASNPRRRLIGKQPGPPEIFPEIDLVETFDKLHFPVKVKNRNLRMDSYPRMYAVLGIMWEQDIAVIEGQPRLTLQEAMKDAKKWAVKERQHQQQVAKELQELGQEVDEDDMIGEIEFLVGRVTSKGLRKLSSARRFPKFLAKVKKLQMSEQRRFLAASVGLQQRLPAAVANWCAQVLVMSQFRTRLLRWTTLRGCNCDEGMPVAASGGHRSNLPQTAAEGTQRAAIWGCRERKKKIDLQWLFTNLSIEFDEDSLGTRDIWLETFPLTKFSANSNVSRISTFVF